MPLTGKGEELVVGGRNSEFSGGRSGGGVPEIAARGVKQEEDVQVQARESAQGWRGWEAADRQTGRTGMGMQVG